MRNNIKEKRSTSYSSYCSQLTFAVLLLSANGLLLVVTGCYPSYAPPARWGIGSMPEPLGKSCGSVQIGYGGWLIHSVESRVTIGLNDRVDLDASLGWGALTIFMPSVGLRYFPFYNKWFKLGFSGGVALGYGGEWSYRDSTSSTDEWITEDEKLAGGGYVGIDLGVRFHRVVSVYVGNRGHATRTRHVPITLWGFHVLGIQFDFHPRVYMSLESGVWYYTSPENDDSAFYATLIYVAFGFRWGKPPVWWSSWQKKKNKKKKDDETSPIDPAARF